MTPAKRRSLAALHESRRGVRKSGDSREREIVLAEVGNLVREPIPGERSIRVVADWCGVSDRTVRRWLSGVDWPPATQVRRLREWVRSVAR